MHVQGLGDKHYQNLKNLRSPDFVFLFFPIETALIALYEHDPNLFQQAWNRKVVLVGPSTLLPTLKTVESIWKNEKQNQNALEIARSGGLLYDKFVLFCEDLMSIGKSLQSAQGSYDEAIKKLRDGKGNLLRQSERLKEFGVRSQKQIPKELENFEPSIQKNLEIE
jgi:DNA recombination protein RmuC